MRLCTSKLVHAFPELALLPEAEGERMLRRVRRCRHIRPLVCVLAGIAVAGAWIALAFAFGPTVWLWADDAVGPIHPAFSRVVSLFAGPYFGCFLGGVVGLCVRDGQIRRALRLGPRAVRCPRCRYGLTGLRVECGGVTCPECGHAVDAERDGICDEDLAGV